MPASGRCLTKVKQPDLDMRFWWAVLPGRGGQPVLLLPTQLVVLSTGNSSNTSAMTMSSSRCSPGIPCGCTVTPAQGASAL